MKSALASLPEEQAPEGLDPAVSVWVSASAGGGKTTLLVMRVLRLLLEGQGKNRRTMPRILCLTYTRAAAAEMQNRIHEELAGWAAASDDALRDELHQGFGLRADKELLKHARRLFGQVLERPEAVRVATLHGFCQMVLNRFPMEAGIAPHFTLLEGDRLEAFQNRVLEAFFARLRTDQNLQEAFNTLAENAGPSRLRKMLEQVFYNQQSWQEFFKNYSSLGTFEKNLCERLSLEDTPEEEAFLGPLCRPPHVNEARLKLALDILCQGSKIEKDCAEKIERWMKDLEQRMKNFESYADAFLTKDFEPRKNLPTKETRKNYPDIAGIIEEEARRVHAIMHRVLALRFFRRQSAWYTLFNGLWRVLQEMKTAQAALTYDDLILKTRALLRNPGVCAWVLYKLDGGIDHLLVDEAQDTSPAQWDILFALLEEFLSGLGAREDITRTIFVVGDEKQSIYSFQGANRARYLQAREELFARLKAAQRHPQWVELKRSRRAPKPILDFVDAVFADEAARAGVGERIAHESARGSEAAYVELWPPIIGAKPQLPVPWTPPLMREEANPAPVILAEKIAGTICGWLKEGWVLASKQRPVEAGDIMILLQRRSQLLLPIVRALKDAHIPVAGIDRMALAGQPAVQDVISLCRFLLLPEDDLALAEVLRGPLVRLSDEQLFILAYDRGEVSLWHRFQQKITQDKAFETAAVYLKALLAITDYVSPFALLNEILFRPCPGDAVSGQHALVRRLGPDAIDPLEELLAAALIQESAAPSLQLFVQSITRSEKETKREQSKAAGQVRILTVHSAKGLEAPIVILPDLARQPGRVAEQPFLFWSEQGFPLAADSADSSIALLREAKDAARQAQEEEHRRLLYVALTRARDVLILCGLAENEQQQDAPWHQFCRKAMERLKTEAISENGENHWRYGDARALSLPKPAGISQKSDSVSFPEWIYKSLEASEEKRWFVNPSQVAARDEKILPPSARQAAFQRGQLLHRLLQMLPSVEKAAREELAYEFLLRQSGEAPEVCRKHVEEIVRILNDKVFAPLFAEGSRAEVPVIGRFEGKRISGQIDRLAVTGSEVLIIDYKTNRPPPENLSDVPRQYLAQMAAYRALLEKIYPKHKVRAALLWTFNLKLMELPDDSYQQGLAILRGA